MSKEGEDQVREIRAPYVTTVDTAVEERVLEQFQVQFPPYFGRFLDERDRRVASELERLEAAVEHNGAKITHLLREMDRRFTEVQEEMDRRFTEAKEERKLLRAEAKEERETLRLEMDHRFAEAQEERKLLRAEAKEEREMLRLEMDRRFAEAKEERQALRTEVQALRTEMRSQIRWVIGLLFPLVVGVIAMIIRVFFVGTF
ncbi:MAG: hypothetical protein ISS49_16370 [Anaerolineae bacterium]|nr:hypothetical protein [Anaerolineae bacterium]